MTDKEKQEIIAEVEASVMEKVKNEMVIKERTQSVLEGPREKWYGERGSIRQESTMCKAFPSPYMAWDAWDHIRRLTCLVCGERYVRQLEGNLKAEKICEEICQKIYDLRMEIGKDMNNGKV